MKLPLSLLLLASLLTFSARPSACESELTQGRKGGEDLPTDIVPMKRGKPLRGRIIERYNEVAIEYSETLTEL